MNPGPPAFRQPLRLPAGSVPRLASYQARRRPLGGFHTHSFSTFPRVLLTFLLGESIPVTERRGLGAVEYVVKAFTHPILTTPVNTVAIHVEDALLVFDAGPYPDSVQKTVEELGLRGGRDYRRIVVMLTHYHWDHSMGISGAPGWAEVCASPATIEFLSSIDRVASVYLSIASLIAGMVAGDAMTAFTNVFKSMYDAVSKAANRVKPLETCTAPGVVNHIPCPGHTPCHTCYLVGSGNAKLLVAGDTVLEKENPPVLDIKAYLESLEKITIAEWSTLIPGHGQPLDRRKGLDRVAGIAKAKHSRLKRVIETIIREKEIKVAKLIVEAYKSQPTSPLELFTRAYSLHGYLEPFVEKGYIEIMRRDRETLVKAADLEGISTTMNEIESIAERIINSREP